MGFSISWLAVHAGPEVAHEALGLCPIGEELEAFDAPLTGAQLNSGWYLIIGDRCDHILISDPVLSRLSALADVVACSIEEHVMASRAEHWSGGRKTWSVLHDAQLAIDHLEVAGEPPAFFAEVRDRLLAQQAAEGGTEAEVDYVFDVPLETAQRITGFKHDVAAEPSRFAVLRPTMISLLAARRRWWQLW